MAVVLPERKKIKYYFDYKADAMQYIGNPFMRVKEDDPAV
jgi:hypothetical protein